MFLGIVVVQVSSGFFFFFQKAIEKDTNAAFTKQGHKDS